jgi:outer membrane receptor protein involved in Fe transport
MALQFRILTGVAFLLLPLGAFPQDNPNPRNADPLEEQSVVGEFTEEELIEVVHVTGTRIARRDFNTPSPLTTIDEDAIDFTPQLTIEETLDQMPQVFPSQSRSLNNGGNGMAHVDLRGLGPGRSLVLLNGRRMAPSGTGNAADLNNIPNFLIENIEIITGGTSAVYGSDAIAGVVNFITFSDYEGFGAEAGFNIAEEGDGEAYNVSLGYGHNFENGNGNITFYANWFDREATYAGSREATRVPRWDGWDGILYEGGSWSTPAGVIRYPRPDLGNGPVNVTFREDGTPREFDYVVDVYNYQPANYLQVPMERIAIGAMGHYDLTERFEGYFEASHTRNDMAYELAPTPVKMTISVNIDNPVLAPETSELFASQLLCDENVACFVHSTRFPEVGSRKTSYEREYSRVVAGIRGELGKGWDIDAWLIYTKASSLQHLSNGLSRSRYCVPLNIFGEDNLSTEGADFIRNPVYENITERTQKLASVYVTGAPFDIWAGSFDMALGVEWRSDDTYFKADDALFDGDGLGWLGRAPVSGVEDVFEAYVEAVIPLLNGNPWAELLELELGARYSDYERAGGVWTYKAGGMWQPFDSLRLRTMFQHSVRAPNSEELFEEQTLYEGVFVGNEDTDPCSAVNDPVGRGVAEKCIIQGLSEEQLGVFEATNWYPTDYWTGGNPDLEPEVGETWTIGAVVTPQSWPNFFISVDYFDFEVTDTIGGINASDICFDELNTGHVLCENITRDQTGNVYEVIELTSNRGLLATTGFDTQLQYRHDLPGWLEIGGQFADLTLSLFWTRVITHEKQENPASEIIDCAGYFGELCATDYPAFPENRVTTNITYQSGPVSINLSWRWIDGMKNAAPLYWWWELEDYVLAIPEVDSENYLDLGMSYRFNDRYLARFGVANLLDNDPPQMGMLGYNTAQSLYDVFGRSYYLRFTAEF